jgi:hypothetical protein
MENLKEVLDYFKNQFEFTLFDRSTLNVIYSKNHNLSEFSPTNLPNLNNTVFQNWSQIEKDNFKSFLPQNISEFIYQDNFTDFKNFFTF